MESICKQCGNECQIGKKFCSKCGAPLNSTEEYVDSVKGPGKKFIKDIKSFKTLPKKKRWKVIISFCCVAVILISISSLFMGAKGGMVTKDGKAYRITVEEYCERFNEIAKEPWCDENDNVLRMQVEAQYRSSLEKAAQLDSDSQELLTRMMTPAMIVGVTLIEEEESEDIPDDEKYVKYTFLNQFSFIPERITIQLLAERDTRNVISVSAIFPMDYRYVGDMLGELVCPSFGDDSQAGGFQDLYNLMKEENGYRSHTYKEGTVFELSYNGDSQNALFKMSASTEKRYKAWADKMESSYSFGEFDVYGDDVYGEDFEKDITNNAEEKTVRKLVKNFEGYIGMWEKFEESDDPYCQMLKKVIDENVCMTELFGKDLSQVNLSISNFQWDGENISSAGCFVDIECENSNTGEYVSISGAINVDEEENLQMQIAN